MSDSTQFEGMENPSPEGEIPGMARWLQQVLKQPASVETPHAREKVQEMGLELLWNAEYHVHFYEQLPDFIMALLTNNAQVAVYYAPLLFHLAGCEECHKAYLDLYDAMRAAVYPRGPRSVLGQGTRTLGATPPRILSHLCRALISQAEALILQTRGDHGDEDEAARSLLQQAMRISASITQGAIRHEALHDLVRVATLSDRANETTSDVDTVRYSYIPTPAGGKRTVRRTDISPRPADAAQEQAAIHLQARALDGRITQHEDILELHLQALDASLRGKHLLISVPLGGLLEPVRWHGGNPRAVRSTVPVDVSGALTTPLGETDLRLTNLEERNLLEAMFLLLEVRAVE